MINILFLDHFSTAEGAQLFLVEIMRNIPKDKFNIFTISPISKDVRDLLLKIERLHILPIVFASLKTTNVSIILENLVLYYRLRNLVLENKINLIFANSTQGQIYGKLLHYQIRIPLLFYIHGPFLSKFIDKLLTHRVDMVLTNSYYMKSVLGNYLPSRKIILVKNAIDFSQREKTTQYQYKEKKDNFIVGMFARITPWKGHIFMIESAIKILNSVPNVKFLFVGPTVEEKYTNRLKALAHKKGLDEHIVFMGYRKDALNIMASCDIVVNCSIKPEPFGRTIIEAGALGKSTVAFNWGGTAEIILDGKTGFLVKPKDVDEFSKAIVKLLHSEKLRETFGFNAKEWVKRNFALADSIKQLENIFEGVCCGLRSV